MDTKKLQRKQSNRESARRSRQRKQSETDQLAESCKALMRENEDLKQQLARTRPPRRRHGGAAAAGGSVVSVIS